MAVDSTNNDIQQKVDAAKLKLEVFLESERKGAAIRANVKWLEQGERNTAYFLGLEKRQRQNTTITSLQSDRGITNNPSEILDILLPLVNSLLSSSSSF